MENSLSLRHLGQTEVRVSPIGLGVMELSGDKWPFSAAFPKIPTHEKNLIIKTALDGGVNWFDTAEMYGFGVSERSLVAGLKAAGRQPGEVVIATKWLPILRTARNIQRNIKKRQLNLADFPIDLYQVHMPLGFSSPEAEMDAMADLVEAGLIRSIGVSNFSAERMQRAYAALDKRGLRLAANQMEYSLLIRKIENNGVLQAAKDLGVTIIAYTPLAAGILTGKYHQNPALLQTASSFRRKAFPRLVEQSRMLIAAMQEIAEKYEATIAQVALNWLINFQGETVVAIPGATRASQSEQNAAAMKFKLSEAELAQLDELSRQFR